MHILEWLAHPYAVTLSRWLLAAVFLVAATTKLTDRRRFAQLVQEYKVLPKHFAHLYALLVPWGELVVGLMLVLGLSTRIAAILGSLLLSSFITAVSINLARGRTKLDCGCFGHNRQKISGTILIRNGMLLLISFQVALFANGYIAIDGLLFGRRQPDTITPPVEGLLFIAFISAGLFALYLLAKQFIVFSKNLKSLE